MGKNLDAKTVGARIKNRRIEKGLTQAQVGEPRFTSAYISLIECGHRNPSDETLKFIADRLDLRLDELLAGIPPGLEADLELQLLDARRAIDKGIFDPARTRIRDVLDAAQNHDLNRVEARAEEVLAALKERTDGPAAALNHFRRAEKLWSDEPIHYRVETVVGLARCSRSVGETHMAVHLLDSYHRELIATMQPHPTALVRTYTEMIYAYFAVGLPEKASEAARRALALESQVQNPEDVACMHMTVARTMLFERRFADALASIRRADEIYSAGGWRSKAAKAKIAEAIVLSKKKDYQVARTRLLSALEDLKESPDSIDEALALNNLGHVSRLLGNLPAARRYLEQALPLLETSDVFDRAFNLRERGLSVADEQPTTAEQHLQQAIDLYRRAGSVDEVAATYKALGDLYVARGEVSHALAAFREGLGHVEYGSAAYQ